MLLILGEITPEIISVKYLFTQAFVMLLLIVLRGLEKPAFQR